MFITESDEIVAKMMAALQGKTFESSTDDDELEPYEFEFDYPIDPVARLTQERRERSSDLANFNPEAGIRKPTTTTQVITDFSSQKSTVKTRDELEGIGMPAIGTTQLENENKQGGFNIDRFMKKYDNGYLPDHVLKEVPGLGIYRIDAARALKAMKRAAKKDGIILTGSGYRSFQGQVELKEQKPTLAATPGTSNHGWGVASDMAVGDYGTEVYNWLMKNGKRFGWVNPEWAQQGGSKEEPWHWEYVGGFKGGKPVKTGGRNTRRIIQKPVNDNPLNKLSSTDSLIFAPTVFGSIVNEVQAPPQTVQEFKKREQNQKEGGLGFVPKKYRNLFREASEKYGVPARLLAAISKTESGFAEDVWRFQRDSSAGAVGPMQVMPLHTATYGNKFMKNARENVMVGTQIFLSYLSAAKEHHLSKQHGALRLALSMYNAGVNASDELLISRMGVYSDPILQLFRKGGN